MVDFTKAPLSHSSGFVCLDNHDVITKKVSDHHPIIHDGCFFWNVMMKCNLRGNGPNYNNGFGLIESNEAYIARLKLVAHVIHDAVLADSSIEHICLCEGPIEPEHIKVLFDTLMMFPEMQKFKIENMFNKPEEKGVNWGLLMLSNTRYTVTNVQSNFIDKFPKLANRLQLWKLEEEGKEKYIALAHFPFAGDEYKTEKMTLSADGIAYCLLITSLLERYSHDSFIFCADFNLNPYLINQWNDRALDKISHNNSILFTHDVKLNNMWRRLLR
jgi:hypothetical protein